MRVPTDGALLSQFSGKVLNYPTCSNWPIVSYKKISARLYYKDYGGITAAILVNAEKSTFIVRKSTQVEYY